MFKILCWFLLDYSQLHTDFYLHILKRRNYFQWYSFLVCCQWKENIDVVNRFLQTCVYRTFVEIIYVCRSLQKRILTPLIHSLHLSVATHMVWRGWTTDHITTYAHFLLQFPVWDINYRCVCTFLNSQESKKFFSSTYLSKYICVLTDPIFWRLPQQCCHVHFVTPK